MFPEESRGRQERLINLLFELSEKLLCNDEEQIEQFLNRLNAIYADDFKHKYSDFFPILMKIYEEDNAYNIDYLSNNLDMLGTYLEAEYSEGRERYSGIYAQFTKLCDHLNLQIGQFNYLLAKEDSGPILQEAIRDLKESNDTIRQSFLQLDAAHKELETSNKNLEESNKKASTIQTELITILSIFAAIVITFSGGLTLLGSSVSSMSNARQYESIVLIAIICGMAMFNTIFLLMYFVSKLTERDIFATCEAEVCEKCQNTECNGINKIRKRLPYVFYYNCASLVGIVIDMVIWFLDMSGYIG